MGPISFKKATYEEIESVLESPKRINGGDVDITVFATICGPLFKILWVLNSVAAVIVREHLENHPNWPYHGGSDFKKEIMSSFLNSGKSRDGFKIMDLALDLEIEFNFQDNPQKLKEVTEKGFSEEKTCEIVNIFVAEKIEATNQKYRSKWISYGCFL